MHKTGCVVCALYAMCTGAVAHRHYNCKKSRQFYTIFPVLMSPLSQSSISEVDFQHLDQYYSFSSWKLLEILLEVLGKSLKFTHTCLYDPRASYHQSNNAWTSDACFGFWKWSEPRILFTLFNVSISGFDLVTQNLVLRRIYPFLLSCVVLAVVCIFQARQFKRLYEHIKNDK